MKYYAIAKGHVPGVYTSWEEAKKQISHYKEARFKKFETLEAAQEFVNLHKTPDFFIKKFGLFPPAPAILSESESLKPSSDALVVFTDGACSNNGKPNAKAGYSVVWPDYPDYSHAERLPASEMQTNNRAEYTGFLQALKTATVIDPTLSKKLYIYTDSMLLVNSITKWMKKWKLNGWKTATHEPVKNKDLLEEIDRLVFARSKVIVEHVMAHTNNTDWKSKYNNEADRLARDSLRKN